ncbi:MAG TPA: XdhC family protein [Nocardioidaceae bacterium]|nr:XdhC family protein [Nocardioidaceae bacterium]
MTISPAERIAELTTARVPFVQVTVVRAQEPSSARPGDKAVVLADGTMEGFVGGQCAVGSVRAAALDALERGTSILLRVLPEGAAGFPDTPGASVVVNPCLSGGALEIYLEPVLPPPVLYLVGSSPTADALATLAPTLGFEVARQDDGGTPEGALAAVVSTHGGDEPGEIRKALDAGVGFVGLVCSHRRGEQVLDQLALPAHERQRVHPHVGVEIGARTAPEIALSIMAAVVRGVRLEGLVPPPGPTRPSRPVQVVDPVCGMTVTVGADTPHAQVDGTDYWFCGTGCRDSFLRGRGS